MPKAYKSFDTAASKSCCAKPGAPKQLPRRLDLGQAMVMPSMDQDFVGRVERLPLPATEANSLMPLYEAVSNSLHAVEDRLGNRAHLDGAVEVMVLREERDGEQSPVIGFCITDNGIGLDEANYRSFLRPDSRHKQRRGGKGVGRLGWLKVFEDIRVDSTWADEAVTVSRSFDFRLAEQDQVAERPGRPEAPVCPGTVVTFQGFRDGFRGRSPVRPETLKQRLISHFLPMVVSPQGIPIRVTDGQEVVSLSDFYRGMIRASAEEDVKFEIDGQEHAFKVQHLRVSKAMKPEKGHNRLFLCANGRTVEQYGIDNSLGLGLLRSDDVYAGCVSGEILDRHVNSERTGFTLDADFLKELRQRLVGCVARFLSEYVDEVLAAKRGTARSLLREYPQFLFLNEDMDGFVQGLQASAQNKEEVFVAMARQRFRRNRDVATLEKQIARKGEENIAEIVERYQRMVTTDQKGVLAEYVLRRRAVLDLLERLREYADDDTSKHHREDALHRLICPMRTDSAKVSYENHNLWLLDDRLAFFAYFNSDSEMRSYTDLGSEDRPDLAFFYDTVSAWVDQQTRPNTAVLVEFKRPMRDDYNGNDNPVRQLTRYVKQLREANNLKDHKGGQRPVALANASYQCYVVADLTATLMREIEMLSLHTTPDGEGRFGYVGAPGQQFYLEIVPYAKLLADARERNSIFFKKLGIIDLDPSTIPDTVVEAALGAREPVENVETEVEALEDS